MSIFAKPPDTNSENEYGVKILFLHGLEGSPSGSKSVHLIKKWSASSPPLRTDPMIDLRSRCGGTWNSLDQEEIDEAIQTPYQDALDAVNYFGPDIIVGSSLGAAILYKLYAKGSYSGASVFLAPAIPHLVSSSEIAEATRVLRDTCSVWVLGETDTIVPNGENASLAKSAGGSTIYSPNDGHRLHRALETGLIDAAILTAIEGMNRV